MEYKGKLYGKVGNITFPLLHTTDDWEAMEKRIAELEAENTALKKLIPNIDEKVPSELQCKICRTNIHVNAGDGLCAECWRKNQPLRY